MRRLAACTLLLTLAGCLPRVGPLLDGGDEVPPPDDGGSGPPPATCFDGQLNGNESDLDCGGSCASCNGLAACRTALDCSSGVCGVAGNCAPPASACPAAFAGCVSWVDFTGASVDRTIHFPLGNDAYGPECARVRFGQTVTFLGQNFGTHPLAQGCGPVNNVLLANQGDSFSVTFNRGLGVYGYYCTRHGSASGSGMAGAIEVVR